jgi:hypothetical protein
MGTRTWGDMLTYRFVLFALTCALSRFITSAAVPKGFIATVLAADADAASFDAECRDAL